MTRRVTACATLFLASTVALAANGCVAAGPTKPDVSFARISGDVHVGEADDTVINLVLVAPSNDPVWAGVHELVVVNDDPTGGDLVFGGGSVELQPGTDKSGLRVGSIPVSIPHEVDRFHLSKVKLTAQQGGEPVEHDVGDWRFAREALEDRVSPIGDYPASVPSCGHVNFDVKSDNQADMHLSNAEISVPGLSVESFEFDELSSFESSVSFDLVCDESFDLFMFTPKVLADSGEGKSEQYLDPILVGYLDLSDDVVRRIADR